MNILKIDLKRYGCDNFFYYTIRQHGTGKTYFLQKLTLASISSYI